MFVGERSSQSHTHRGENMATQLDLPKGFSIGDNVAVKIGETLAFYNITNRDNIQFVDDESNAISAGSTESYTERTQLDPPSDQMYQLYRIEFIKGNVKVQLKQPASTNRFGVEKSPEGGYITDRNDNVPLNLFVLENYPPNLQVINGTRVSITPKFRWHGWRYMIKTIPQPQQFTIVNALGLSR